MQREWVLPASTGEKWTLKRFAWVFDGLSERDPVKVPAKNAGDSDDTNLSATVTGDQFEWKDVKRVVLAMLANNGMGGDGTVTYYIMQEGEVKPRQHG